MLSELRLRDWVALLGFDVAASMATSASCRSPRGRPRAKSSRERACDGGRLPAQGAQAHADPDPGSAEPASTPAGTRGRRGTDQQTRSLTDHDEVELYTDGACRGNPGPGGWAALLVFGKQRKEVSGAEAATTNNRMELTAAIEGLEGAEAALRACELYTDSKYVLQGTTEWLPNWKARGWRTAAREPVKNQDLWERLDAAARDAGYHWLWVKGHSGHDGNEFVDSARESSRSIAAQGR